MLLHQTIFFGLPACVGADPYRISFRTGNSRDVDRFHLRLNHIRLSAMLEIEFDGLQRPHPGIKAVPCQ